MRRRIYYNKSTEQRQRIEAKTAGFVPKKKKKKKKTPYQIITAQISRNNQQDIKSSVLKAPYH